MGIFSWLFPKAEETVAERVLPPGLEEPKSAEEIVLESKYKYFRVPYNVDSKQLLKAYNECISDIRIAKDSKWITKINYCALICINAIIRYYLKMANAALKKNECYLVFYVLKIGLSPIDLSALTVPETERISPIIKMITYTQIPEELKLFQVRNFDNTYDIDTQQLTRDAIVKIHDFFKIYKEILSLLRNEIKSPDDETILGGLEFNLMRSIISRFIKSAEDHFTLLEHAAGSDIEIFREDYLCHSTYEIRPVLNTRLFFETDLYFCLNHVHTGSRPTLILSVADILNEAKERNLNFAFTLLPKYSTKLFFAPKQNLFYDKDKKIYFTFQEIKDMMRQNDWVAVIYSAESYKEYRLRSPGVFVASDTDLKLVYPPMKTLGNQYLVFKIQIVPEEQQNPQKRMFTADRFACNYLLHDTEGRRILKSMLESQRRI